MRRKNANAILTYISELQIMLTTKDQHNKKYSLQNFSVFLRTIILIFFKESGIFFKQSVLLCFGGQLHHMVNRQPMFKKEQCLFYFFYFYLLFYLSYISVPPPSPPDSSHLLPATPQRGKSLLQGVNKLKWNQSPASITRLSIVFHHRQQAPKCQLIHQTQMLVSLPGSPQKGQTTQCHPHSESLVQSNAGFLAVSTE